VPKTPLPQWLHVDGRWLLGGRAALRLARVDALSQPALAESLPVKAGKPVYLREHLVRLAEGCHALRWPQPDLKALAKLCHEAIHRNGVGEGGLRVRYWPVQPSLFVIQAMPARAQKNAPIRLMTSAVRHYGPDALGARSKAAQMLPNWLASAETRAWAEDGLRLTQDGYVAEGVWTNIVAVKRRVARTPPLHQGLLEGVTRAKLLERMAAKGHAVREEPLTRYDLWAADEVWITSSLRGALRVSEVDGRAIG
jgi:branched-chain amino acid aminotransferase